MKITLVRSMARSAVFELVNSGCYRAPAPYTVSLDGATVCEGDTNVFSLYSLEPGRSYTLAVTLDGVTDTLNFTTAEESFFVDASRYGLVADGVTDNTAKLQAALSTCPAGGTVYVPAGTYRTQSLFLQSSTTLYLEKGCTLLGGTNRTDYPILPGVLPCHNEKDEHYLGLWEGNPLDSFAGLLNITQVHDVVVTGEGTLDCDAENGDWWVTPKIKRIAWRPRAVAAVDSENICLHGITVQNSYSWTIHPIFVKHLDLLNFNINNPYNAPNTDGIDPESCKNVNIIGNHVHVGDDCIALKSGKLFLGMKLHVPCENVIIRNCCLSRGHGGLVIGSEMSGGVKNVTVTQCLMDHTDRGLRVKTRRPEAHAILRIQNVSDDFSVSHGPGCPRRRAVEETASILRPIRTQPVYFEGQPVIQIPADRPPHDSDAHKLSIHHTAQGKLVPPHRLMVAVVLCDKSVGLGQGYRT